MHFVAKIVKCKRAVESVSPPMAAAPLHKFSSHVHMLTLPVSWHPLEGYGTQPFKIISKKGVSIDI